MAASHPPTAAGPDDAVPDSAAVTKAPRKRVYRPLLADRKTWFDRLKRDARQVVSGVVVSCVVHAVLLVLAAMYVIRQQQSPADSAPLGMGWFEPGAYERAAAEAFAPIELPTIESPVPDQPEQPSTQNRNPSATAPAESTSGPRPAVAPVDVGGALSGRGSGGSGVGTGRSGPIGDNEDLPRAIDKALGWIARQQQRDGRWKLDTGYPDAGRIKTDTGATALALLAILGAGHTHQEGNHQAAVQKGLDWLRSIQRPSGDLFDITEEGKDAHFYAHAQGTIVLCEALALTHDPALEEPARNAVAFLAAAQNPVNGGWKYRPLGPTGIGDLSVTGWALMALHSARMANIDVPPESFLVASEFLNSVQESPYEDAFYKYRPDWDAAGAQRWSMTAEGLLCRQWLGWPKNDPALRRGVEFLLSEEHKPEWAEGRRNLYAWYYTAQTLHNMGGDDWQNWFAQVQSEIVSHQAPDGSWHPTRPRGADLEYADQAGRLYITVLAALILETPFRHAPIYGDE